MIFKENKIDQEEINLWTEFAKKYSLTEAQLSQFQTFAQMLQKRNEEINLTSITKLSDIIYYHFEDSLSIGQFIDLNKINSICDIGSGGGFPGIPLKIKYPHLRTILIEVIAKKVNFLDDVIQQLGLNDVSIYNQDWRTFLRKTDDQVDIFFSRASLHTDELIRVFMPSSPYNGSQLIYWASTAWQASSKDEPYLKREETYKVGNKKRKLIFFNK